MFGAKSQGLPQLEHYLAWRAPYNRYRHANWGAGRAAAVTGGLSVLSFVMTGFQDPAFLMNAADWIGLGAIGIVFAGFFATRFLVSLHSRTQAPEDGLMERAELVAHKMKAYSARHRLKAVLHPGVATVLEECAGFWHRIKAVTDRNSGPDMEPHWLAVRQDWNAAADLAMAEALILADAGMTEANARPRVEEVVEDLLDTYVFRRPNRPSEPLPPTFEPLRNLAEKLKMLASEVEDVSRRSLMSGRADQSADASGRLDQVLSELRSLKQAESELRQDLRS